jgi:hypothetical protein
MCHCPIYIHDIVHNYIMKYRSNFNFIRVRMIYVLINVYYSVQDQSMTLLTRCVESMEFRVWCKWPNSEQDIFAITEYVRKQDIDILLIACYQW